VEAQGAGAARVPARPDRQGPLPARRQRGADRDRDRQGPPAWRRKIGHLSASTPAVDGKHLIATVLERARGVPRGRIVSMRCVTARSAGSASCRVAASPRRSCTRGACTSAPKTAPCTRGGPYGPHRVALPGGGRH
jgi:hypothetical protein